MTLEALPQVEDSVARSAPSSGGRPILAFGILGVAIALVACGFGEVTGAGPKQVEVRNVAPFTGVEVGNGINLTLQVGGEQAVEVLAQENILGLIITTVDDGILRISAGSFSTAEGVTVTVSAADLDALSVADGSQVRVDGLTADQLAIEVSGGAGLVATGSAKDLTLSSTGGAQADLAGLATKTMRVDLSGGATAALNVSDRVTGTATGGANATVVGGATVNVETSGGAVVSRD